MKRKKFFLLCALLLALFLASFKGASFYIERSKPTTATGIVEKNIEVKKELLSSDAKKEEKEEKKEPAFYDILGSSNKLSQKETASMSKWRKDIVELSKKNPNTVVINGNQEDKIVALTFDDGPDSQVTPKVLDVLKQYNVKGSFFFIGERIKNYTELVKRTDREGHLILGHSFNHPNLTEKSSEKIKEQLELTEAAIYKVIGKKPSLMRPPYGATDDKLIKEAEAQGLKLILWSTDTLDWSQKEKNNIVKNVVDNVRPGEIILMHSNEDKKATYEALADIITKLQEKGYKFVGLDELLNLKGYK